ncbi:RloB family protein [Levilactobacillus cerevisiae]|uniref:RloB family protein n=1 Tax=Levilactobacillus cerevisiae TaxID=1704076 RepID=UPI000F7816FD|nr:RloB family protein [Levilactobacillus cerevisiae]
MSRKSRQLNQKKVTVIYCEGESEKAYFEMLSAKYRSGANVHTEKVQIETIAQSRGADLIEKAARKMARLPRNKQVDQAYVVFDRDNLTQSDLEHCGRVAREHQIKIIFSSINFEVWILMHFETVSKAYTGSQLNQRLSGSQYFNQDYSKFKGRRYDHFLFDRVNFAVVHGQILTNRQDNFWLKSDPYTNVHEVLTDIYGVTQF